MNRNYSDLRELIIKILGEELGFYTLPNKQTIPAITIKQPIPYPEAGTTQTGLEIVIVPESDMDIQNYLGSILVEEETKVILNQWDSERDTAKATNLLAINLQPHWNIKRIGPVVQPNWNFETIESRVIYLSESNSYRFRK